MFCERGHIVQQQVPDLGGGGDGAAAELTGEDFEALAGVDGAVAVAGGDEPPHDAAGGGEVGGLDGGGVQDHAGAVQERGEVGEGFFGGGRVLDDFEREDQVVFAGGAGGKFGNEGVIGVDAGKALGAEVAGEFSRAAAVVEDGDGFGCAEDFREILGVGFGADVEIVGVEAAVLVVVNFPTEIVVGEVVEGGGEDESAGGAAVVVDGTAGERGRGLGRLRSSC